MASSNAKEVKGNEGIVNHDSPYYLHPSDYPRQLHVNDVLTDGNYNDWKEEMQNFSFAKNKIGFVNAMEKEIITSVRYAPTAQDIWADLKERFDKESAPRAYKLKQSLMSTRQNRDYVSTYFTKLRVIWDEIQSMLPAPKCNCDCCVCGIGKKLVDIKDKEYYFLKKAESNSQHIVIQIG
ncbi:uncharacterized protein LOC143625882 [Bidens hawaiensis]|uniref:uncharacterized protein LOC143625882 n=1 Tax=Bidens hawaiensis TaxID=980011 RepID=UPI004049375F